MPAKKIKECKTSLNLQAFHPKAEYGWSIRQVFWLIPIFLPSHMPKHTVACSGRSFLLYIRRGFTATGIAPVFHRTSLLTPMC